MEAKGNLFVAGSFFFFIFFVVAENLVLMLNVTGIDLINDSHCNRHI